MSRSEVDYLVISFSVRDGRVPQPSTTSHSVGNASIHPANRIVLDLLWEDKGVPTTFNYGNSRAQAIEKELRRILSVRQLGLAVEAKLASGTEGSK